MKDFMPSIIALSFVFAASLPLRGQVVDASDSEMRPLIERYSADRSLLNRSSATALSSDHIDRLGEFYSAWLTTLDELDFDALSQGGRIDYVLFRNQLDYELRQLDVRARNFAEALPLLAFAPTIIGLAESRRRMESIDGQIAGETLAALAGDIDAARQALEADGANGVTGTVANRAAATAGNLRDLLENWFDYYNGYDPLFTWWADAPYAEADASLEAYVTYLREDVAGLGTEGSSDVIGDPIGRAGLMTELAREMIPYSPEELIAIANVEYAWCEAELIEASRELGFGDDWLEAIEHVKGLYVEPGEQPDLIRDLALEAIDFVEQRNLVTIPALARDTWRMQMMSPERQRVNPFFTGGEVISVSYPTPTMSHEQKLMSMRGNNIHFARATVHHELIPGHHLQGFMADRFKSYRRAFSTPFWGEGWALYWEMLLWDLDFARGPEDRVGMLFWRMHRAARIIFSLSFHLGEMTPQEAIDYLVDGVGHERENAIAEVRRSFGGDVDPLYQAAYMLGGLQLRALHEELVGSGRMTNQAFHDAVLKENRIPIEMVRASLTGQELSRDFTSQWKFYGPDPIGEAR